MNLRDFRLLADENIHPDVTAFLRAEGFDVLAVRHGGLARSDDVELIRLALAENRIVVTHDRDFGRLAIAQLEPMVGILFVRPGQIDSAFTIATLRVVLAQTLDLCPPFILVAERTRQAVRIRLRRM